MSKEEVLNHVLGITPELLCESSDGKVITVDECYAAMDTYAASLLANKEREIIRLKHLVQEAFSEGATCAILVNQPLTKSWSEFKEKYLS